MSLSGNNCGMLGEDKKPGKPIYLEAELLGRAGVAGGVWQVSSSLQRFPVRL